MNDKIKELQEKVNAIVAKNTQRLQESVEIAKLEATLKLESDEGLFAAKVRQEAVEQQTAKLQTLVDECEGIISTVPIMNPKTRANRQWAASKKFNYGTQINLMYQLATGIMFSCNEHKQLLLAHTGLSMGLLEDVVEAFGTPTYYSRNYHSVVEAKPYNVDRVKDTVAVMQSRLGVVVDTSALQEKNFAEEFERAKGSAKDNYNQALEALEEADFDM